MQPLERPAQRQMSPREQAQWQATLPVRAPVQAPERVQGGRPLLASPAHVPVGLAWAQQPLLPRLAPQG